MRYVARPENKAPAGDFIIGPSARIIESVLSGKPDVSVFEPNFAAIGG
jgi:hypothetical protein